MRYVEVRGVRYLHAADIADMIRATAATEETDTRRRLEGLADQITTASPHCQVIP